MIQQEGQPPRALTAQEIVSLVQQQQQHIQGLTQQNAELRKIIEEMQKQLLLQTNFPVLKSKLNPDIPINITI